MTNEVKGKKVEFLELIYDLIFVYIIGRNNSLMHHIENGFVSWQTFLAYILCTLAVIQIWNYSTFYINLYGRNGVRDYIFLFVNMDLLYYMADGTSVQWQSSVYRYSTAWGLILINIGVQYLIETRNHKDAPWELKRLKRNAAIILTEAALVGVHAAVYAITGVSTPYVPIAFGMIAMIAASRSGTSVPVDFAHLTERAMLYIVFTFGEMIISIASYFSEGFTFNGVYFSLMAFLIVAGLFLSYGTMYNRIIDREMTTNGIGYMTLHLFLIFALNNISVALEFMRDEKVDLFTKTLFLAGSFVMYFTFLFLTARYAKRRCAFNLRFVIGLAALAVSFIVLMLLLRGVMYANIAVTVAYVFVVFLLIFRRGRYAEGAENAVERV